MPGPVCIGISAVVVPVAVRTVPVPVSALRVSAAIRVAIAVHPVAIAAAHFPFRAHLAVVGLLLVAAGFLIALWRGVLVSLGSKTGYCDQYCSCGLI